MRNVILYALAITIVSLLTVAVSSYNLYMQNHTSAPQRSETTIPPDISKSSNTTTTAARNTFLTYENPAYGIRIQYPSYWDKAELSRNFIVGFFPPSENDSGLFENLVVGVTRFSPSLSLNDFAAARISSYKSQYSDFHLIDSSLSKTSTGTPIYKTEYTHNNGRLAIKTMEVWATKGTIAFMILYNADTPEYSNLVPTIQKMVASFSIEKAAAKLKNA
jgi:hypothetical protein